MANLFNERPAAEGLLLKKINGNARERLIKSSNEPYYVPPIWMERLQAQPHWDSFDLLIFE
jgi:hypothetical protein